MLPVEEVLPQLAHALRVGSNAVLVAPPGAGKTTHVPLALLEEPWAATGKIVLLSPRRLAARAAAARMAHMLGERVGETVGFRVRLESRVGAKTRIEVVTEGVFTRQIIADPSLSGIACVIFDEFHERSLEGDLGLALALDAQGALREDLKLLVMSATLDAARVAGALGDAPVVQSQGRMFPIQTRYLGRDPRGRIEDAMADAVRQALRSESGSILCFLPGAGEIERTARLLEERVRDPDVDIRPLYGAMESAAQDAAVSPAASGRRKIVLATSIAEISITIEGVRVVIDSGLSRRPKYEPSAEITRLETVRASQAAVDQRRGRAGRTEPGACWRLWDEGETRALPPFDPPEIMECDLSGLALDLAAWGVSDPAALTWLDPPPAPAWTQAQTMLREIGAFDDGRLSAHGQKIAALPLPARQAHMVVRAASEGRGLLAARLALLMTEQGLGGRDIDARERLRRFASDNSPRGRAARQLAERSARQAGGSRDEVVNEDDAGRIIALGFPERVAKTRAARSGEFLLANGRGAALEAADGLARESYLAIADLTGRAERARVLLAAPLQVSEIETLFADKIERREQVEFDAASGAVRARRARMLGRIALSEGPLEKPSAEALSAALLEAVKRGGLSLLPWRESEKQFRARVALMRRVENGDWPDLGDAALMETIEDWLAPALVGVSRLSELEGGALLHALENALPYSLRARLDKEAPKRLETPAGGSALIDYEAEGGPSAQMRLQEMFGVSQHPTVANGRVPLTIVLLSPAQRPIQTTKDLPGFWRGSYAAVRADMRGRYPKHPWPEDPLNAEPTRRAKPRGS